KRQGAIAASFAVYGRTAADCAAASGSTTGAPQGGLVVGLVVQFRDTNGAALNYRRDSTPMGLGPRDVGFMEVAGGTTTFRQAAGVCSAGGYGPAPVDHRSRPGRPPHAVHPGHIDHFRCQLVERRRRPGLRLQPWATTVRVWVRVR